MDALWYYVVVFTLYSVAGWCLDALYTRIREGRWVKRGFHHGPFYMLYGWGALASVLLFNEHSPLYVVVPVAFIYSCMIEYGGSALFERIGLSYWDYHNNKFNLNGRICLEGISLFTAAVVIVVYAAQPALEQWLSMIPQQYIAAVGMLAFCYLFVWGAARMVI